MTFRTFTRSALIVPLATPFAHAADKGKVNVPLEWKPTSTLAESMGAVTQLPSGSTRIWVAPFTDTRSDKALIAENREKAEPRPITTKDDVAAFLGAHAKDLYREVGLPLAASEQDAAVVVKVEVLRCMVVEQDTYKGQISLLIQVESDGKTLWRGTVMGEATRWGRSYKLENYYEAISDSLVDAIGKSLKSESFLAALAGKPAN